MAEVCLAEDTAPRRAGVLPRTWTTTAVTAVAPVTWGTTYLVTTEFLPPDRPLLSGAIRALPAGLMALAATRSLPHGVWWLRAAVLGTLNIGAFFALLFAAAYRLPGGVAATLSALQPLAVAGLAYLLLGERPTRWRLSWGAAGAAGVAAMVLRGRLGLDPLGILAGVAATSVMACGIVLGKRWGRPDGVGVLAFTGWQLTAGGLLLAGPALAFEGLPARLGLPAVGGYLWLSLVGTLAAYALWFRGLGRLPVATASFLPLLSPVVATTAGWLFLGQGLNAQQLLGFALAMTAVAAAQYTPRRRPGAVRRAPAREGNR